jgi:L-fuconolactonase
VCCAPGETDFGAIGEVAQRGLPLDLEVTTATLPVVSRIADEYPELRIAIDHLGRPDLAGSLEEWARGLGHAATHSNVFCKLSSYGAVRIRAAVQHALATFGPARLMFGSDWPNALPDISWKQTLAAFTQSLGPQSMDVREELLGGTAQRFYGLPQ